MTTRSEVELALDRYLTAGAEQVPDRVIDAALDQIDQLPQRRALRVPWRFQDMSTFLKPAIAGAAVVAVLVVGGTYLTGREAPGLGAGGTAPPSPTVPATATPRPTPSPTMDLTDTSNWVITTSEQYGYEIAYPPGWTAQPATSEWSLEEDRTDWVGYGIADRFRGNARNVDTLVTAFAADVPDDMSEDEWIAAYHDDSQADASDAYAKLLRPVTVDGHAGRIANDPADEAQAYVFIDGRVHVFAIWRQGQEELLRAFLSTVRFPE